MLALFGVADAGYLTWQWYASATASWCDLNAYFSCTRVRESPFAQIAGVPVALLGLIGFLILLGIGVMALAGYRRIGLLRAEGGLLIVAGVGAGIGTGLTIIEIAVIQAICFLCGIGFGLDLAILGVAVLLMKSPLHPSGASFDQGFI